MDSTKRLRLYKGKGGTPYRGRFCRVFFRKARSEPETQTRSFQGHYFSTVYQKPLENTTGMARKVIHELMIWRCGSYEITSQ